MAGPAIKRAKIAVGLLILSFACDGGSSDRVSQQRASTKGSRQQPSERSQKDQKTQSIDLSAVPQYQSVLIEGVPHIKQKEDFCGEAAAAMYLRKLGDDADQDFVFDRSGLDPLLARGCHAAELANALEQIGFKIGNVWANVSKNDDIESVFSELHRDLVRRIPSIVCMHYDDLPVTTEHFRLVLGYDAETDEVIYHEPAIEKGAYRRMAKQMFEKLWPLGSRDKRFVVRLRLEPGELEVGYTSDIPTPADFAQQMMKLKPKLTSALSVSLWPPFIVVREKRHNRAPYTTQETVGFYVTMLKQDFFSKDPKRIIEIWLLNGDFSYRHHAKRVFDHSPSTPYGYYSKEEDAMVMNIATGWGTLSHELVHPYVEVNFPACPAWFNEGLGSLFERPGVRDGHLIGGVNWRLPGLKAAIGRGDLMRFKRLMSTTSEEFYNRDSGTNYAQARYLLYYLQERGLLVKYYHEFVKNHKSDSTGFKTLKRVLKTSNINRFQRQWEKWIMNLPSDV